MAADDPNIDHYDHSKPTSKAVVVGLFFLAGMVRLAAACASARIGHYGSGIEFGENGAGGRSVSTEDWVRKAFFERAVSVRSVVGHRWLREGVPDGLV